MQGLTVYYVVRKRTECVYIDACKSEINHEYT